MSGRLPGAPHGLRQAAGMHQVVVLDEDGVIQPHAVIAAPAGAHRVFLQDPQPGQGLARAGDARGRALGLCHGSSRQGGDAAQMRHEIQGRALGRQQRTHRPLHACQYLPGLHPLPVLRPGLECHGRVKQVKGQAGQIQPSHHARLTAGHIETGGGRRWNDGSRRDVATPPQVLGQRLPHERLQHDIRQWEWHAAKVSRTRR